MGGTSLRIFFPDGSSEGLRLLEKSNWTGHGLLCPRPVFGEANGRMKWKTLDGRTLKEIQEAGAGAS